VDAGAANWTSLKDGGGAEGGRGLEWERGRPRERMGVRMRGQCGGEYGCKYGG
jgi:hypothetical protein